ncbi:hypothetical protein [Enterococcus malodoratus]|uniref:hypothetical protein n=1 Tax=Enterococcus malodoratus TaxID=71451 RepID=UPI0022E0C44F|nr:hypothetical protein [Enterococcus malodoratus]
MPGGSSSGGRVASLVMHLTVRVGNEVGSIPVTSIKNLRKQSILSDADWLAELTSVLEISYKA